MVEHMYIKYKHMLDNMLAVGGHTCRPACMHTIGQLKWYMLPKGNYFILFYTCVKQKHNKKEKICSFYEVPGNRQALLGMCDIKN